MKKQKLSFDKRRPIKFDLGSELEKGVQCHQSGQLEKAREIYERILKASPNHSDSLHLLGLMAHQNSENGKAINLIKEAIENDPKNPIYYNTLGSAFQNQGNLDEAVRYYEKALQLCPNLAGVQYNMGNALKDQGKSDEAISCYQKAAQLKPDYAEAYNNMGNVLEDQGKSDEAISCYEKAIQLKPQYAEAYYNMANAFRDQGKSDEAISCYQKAAQLKPDYAEAYNNMGNVLQDQGKSEKAIFCYQKAVQLKPGSAKAYDNMGNAFKDQGKLDKAISCFEEALQLESDPGIQVKMSFLLPVICDSKESIEEDRKRLIEKIESLRNQGLTLVDPHKQVGTTNFYLGFHGLNDRRPNEDLASFYIHACPSLAVKGFDSSTPKQIQDKIRLGIISNHLYKHTIGALNHGMVENISRDHFHVILFRTLRKEDDFSERLNNAADEVVILPTILDKARQRIAETSLDILFYLDVGMDPLTYFLAFSRLAPVQCVTWGHPVTTGIPNIDYFISCENSEPPGAKHDYSERLVLLKSSGLYYYRPQMPKGLLSRQRLGLPEDYHLYTCPQSLFKFHPDFDNVLGDILRQDPRGLLVLIEGTHRHWTKLLHDRFVRTFPDAADRVRFLPRMPSKDFLSLCMLADVILDTPHFSGGKTSLDCFAFGIPIVTWPGQFMRGRLTLAFYKQMGVMDCVASGAKSYVHIALRLANDETWRDEIKDKIRSHADVLYEDIEAVHELERFFEWAVNEESKRAPTSH